MNSLKIQTNAKIPTYWLDRKIQRYTASPQIAIGLDLENLLTSTLGHPKSKTDSWFVF